MPKSVEICQFVARATNHTTWNIPHIRDGDSWRNINNGQLVGNQNCINGHDNYEDAIFCAKRIMEQRGWITEITDIKKPCHEHLYYQQFTLRCWKAE
jgi:hypothetical protein